MSNRALEQPSIERGHHDAERGAVALFRREALLHRSARGRGSALLEIDAETTRWGFRVLALGMVVTVGFLVLGRMNEYASGPAIVRLDQASTLTASFAALVSEVPVKPGDVVDEGAVLVRFRAAAESAELEAASREFDDQLAKLLQRPDDPAARDTLVALRARRELARSQVDQRTLRAPHHGTVGGVRVHEGQLVEAGASLVELQGDEGGATVVALLPGRYRPLLHRGSTLRFELEGFHRRAYELPLATVGDQIIGPAEAARYVGRDSADSYTLSGPVVLVEARFRSSHFEVDGQTFGLAGGMYGKAESVVRNEPLAFAFVPSLKPWAERVKPVEWGARAASWVGKLFRPRGAAHVQ